MEARQPPTERWPLSPEKPAVAASDKKRSVRAATSSALAPARVHVTFMVERLSARACAELLEGDRIKELTALLDDRGLFLFTINGFPYGEFHGAPVKASVYEPDWLTDARVRYTNNLASVLAAVLPANVAYGSISTVPVGPRRLQSRLDEAAQRVAEHVEHLSRVEQQTGKRIVLAFEPEPGCALETTAEAVAFLGTAVYEGPAADCLAKRLHRGRHEAERLMRRHVGVCLDACHAAVSFERAAETVSLLRQSNVPVAKLQLSAGLRVRPVDAAAVQALESFADDVYLHQVIALRDGRLHRWADLPAAIADAQRRGTHVSEEWRIHFHVPIFYDRCGRFSTTRAFLEELLALQRGHPISEHLEVETYSWQFVPPELRGADVVDDIVRELEWARGKLSLRDGSACA